MQLFIDTTNNDLVILSLYEGNKVIAHKEFGARYQQAEKLLPEINKMIKAKKLSLKDVKEIKVANAGGSFTSLRIGVITANALAYALGIPVKAWPETKKSSEGLKRVARDKQFAVIKPIYDREPNITTKK